MPDLKSQLKRKLKGVVRAVILGIGSELRADDAVGMLVAKKLQKAFEGHDSASGLKIFLAGVAPENFTSEIKKFRPSHIIIIDSVNVNKRPGDILLLKANDTSGSHLNTHRLSIKLLAEYITKDVTCEIIIIGIQPKSINFGESISKEVKDSADFVFNLLKDIFRNVLIPSSRLLALRPAAQ